MFVSVAQIDQLTPGKGLVVDADGFQLAVFQTGEGLFAVDALCPHAEGPLAEGDVEGTTVYCPWHGWAFDLTSGQCRQGAHVRSYATRVVDGEVQVEVPD